VGEEDLPDQVAPAAHARLVEHALEVLLDGVRRDHQALAQLFEAGAVLVAGGGLEEARGRQEIARVAAAMWDLERSYLADPRRVLQVRDTALVRAGRAINVVRRGDDGSWRYAISLLDLAQTTAWEER